MEDGEEFAEAALAFGGLLSALNAVVEVGVNDFFGEGLEGFAGGDELGEDFGAIALALDHALDAVELADDFSDAGLEGFCFFLGVMMEVVCHGGEIQEGGDFGEGEICR